jgi:phosphoserine phosphatase
VPSVGTLAGSLEARDGRLTGRYVNGDCTGEEKVRRIRARYDVDAYATVYAYGDTVDEVPMLGLAHRRYFRWREVQDPAAAAAAYRTGDPNHPDRLREVEEENHHLDRLVREQDRSL